MSRQNDDPMPQMSGAFERPDGSVVLWFGNPEIVAWRERNGIPPLNLDEGDDPVGASDESTPRGRSET